MTTPLRRCFHRAIGTRNHETTACSYLQTWYTCSCVILHAAIATCITVRITILLYLIFTVSIHVVFKNNHCTDCTAALHIVSLHSSGIWGERRLRRKGAGRNPTLLQTTALPPPLLLQRIHVSTHVRTCASALAEIPLLAISHFKQASCPKRAA